MCRSKLADLLCGDCVYVCQRKMDLKLHDAVYHRDNEPAEPKSVFEIGANFGTMPMTIKPQS